MRKDLKPILRPKLPRASNAALPSRNRKLPAVSQVRRLPAAPARSKSSPCWQTSRRKISLAKRAASRRTGLLTDRLLTGRLLNWGSCLHETDRDSDRPPRLLAQPDPSGESQWPEP